MAIPSGLSAQLTFAQETTYGTLVAPTRAIPFSNESIESEFEPLESDGIIAGATIRRSNQWAQGVWRHEGDIELEAFDRSIGLLLVHALGSVTTSGTTAPFTHTITPGDLTGKGLTIQSGRTDRGGTVRPFTFGGCKIDSLELAVETGELATLGLSVIAQTVTTGTSLQTASYAADIAPFRFTNGSFSLAGSSLCIRSASLSIENNLDTDRLCVGQNYIDQPLQGELREITGEVELEFPDLVHWARFVAGTEGALQLALTLGTASLTFLLNVRTDQATPTVEGRELLVQTMNFTAVGTNGDPSALTCTYVCSDTTP